MSGQYKVAWLCEALLVSRSGYYDWTERRRRPGRRHLENLRLRQRIREEFVRSRQTYGSPRLAQVLGCPGRRNTVARLMRAEGLFARQRSKYRVATTDSRHGGPIAPNRFKGLTIKRPNQVWTTDATCVLTGQGVSNVRKRHFAMTLQRRCQSLQVFQGLLNFTCACSRNAVSFSSARTTNRFPSSRCASAIQIVRPLESTAETQPQLQPALLRLSAIDRAGGTQRQIMLLG